MTPVPSFDEYMRPIIVALRRLGGSATIQELYEAVVDEMKLTEDQLSALHDPDRGDQTEAAYRMAWARTYLKKAGFLTNSERGVWALTPAGREQEPDPDDVVEHVRVDYANRRLGADSAAAATGDAAGAVGPPEVLAETDAPDALATWTQTLTRKLLSMRPDAFERLCQ